MLTAAILFGCVDVQSREQAHVMTQAGDLLQSLPAVAQPIAGKAVEVYAILMPAEGSSERPEAFVRYRDTEKVARLKIADHLELPNGDVATLRGLESRAAYFEINGKREVLVMPPMTFQTEQPADRSEPSNR